MRYKVFDPESKVIGQAMLGFKAAADREMIQPMLEKYGLTDIQPEHWYPLQTWLDVLSDISEKITEYASMLTFVNIGQKVAANVLVPEEVDQAIKAQGFINVFKEIGPLSYFRDHHGNVGIYRAEKISETHIKFIFQTPYPPDFFYGAVHGSMKRYIPSFIVQYEDLAMRNFGAGETVVIHGIVE